MPKPGTLADGARVHVVRDAAITYRENGGPEDEHEAARVLARLAYDATPVERGVEPEVWATHDRERELAITLRVIRWRGHAVVLGVSVQADDAPRIGDAQPVEAVVRSTAEALEVDPGRARAELRAAAFDARPADGSAGAGPEEWSYRSRLTGDSVTLRIVRTGDGPALIVAAEWAKRTPT